jgi:hypothetical protein
MHRAIIYPRVKLNKNLKVRLTFKLVRYDSRINNIEVLLIKTNIFYNARHLVIGVLSTHCVKIKLDKCI